MPKQWWLAAFAGAGLLLALANLAYGSVPIPVAEVWNVLVHGGRGPAEAIIMQVRLPEMITAAAAGAGLAAAGLLMQTVFHNPLAGPGVLGITGGASLGVAAVLLATPFWSLLPIPADLVAILAALAGAVAVMLIITFSDRRVGDGVTLLVLGLMIGYLCSAVLSVLQAGSEAGALKGFVLWGMGSFAGVVLPRTPWLVLPVLVGVAAALGLSKPLNAMLLGDEQASTMGVDVRRVRSIAIWTTGLLGGTITAFCGPVAFLGLAVPHVARAFTRTADHRLLMPATVLLGAALALACDLLVRSAWTGVVLPLNAVTSLLGVPVVIWVLIGGRSWARK